MKSPIDYTNLLEKSDNTAYLEGIAKVRAAFRQAETALGGPVVMVGEWDEREPFVYRMMFRRKAE